MLVLNDMTKYLEYDAEKTDKFIDDFSHVLNQHESKAAMLYSIYGRYCHNDTFVGDTATKTKLYIAAHQKFLSDNHELQRAIYKKYCDIASNFSDTVDSSPKARIKMSVLKKVKSDYREMSDTLEYHGRKIMNLAQELQDEFGEFGDFTIPDFNSAIYEYDEFCGSSGFLDKCMNNLIEFNEWSSDTVDNSGLYDAEKHMQKKISATVNILDSMTVYQPDMPQNSIELVALGASVGVAGAATALGAKQENKDITLEKCSANSLSAASASIPLGQRYAQKNLLEKIKKAKKNYEDQVKYNKDQKAGKTLAELQSLNTPHANLPDYTEEIDKWVAEQEKYFDPMYKNSHHTGGGKGQFMLKFIDKVKTTGDMDIKQQDKWEKAFHMPYPPATGQPYFLYHGQVMDPATLGNVVYAYVGAKYYPDEMLRFGGGAVQTKRRDSSDLPFIFTIPDYGEMPEDVQAINLGLRWRKEGFPDER